MMKTRCLAIAMCLLGGLGFGALNASGRLEVSAGSEITAETEFYEPLSDQGSWIEVAPYGRCWRPARVEVEWRPYCYGHWEWTDCGWYWASDEPLSWACYHYGRWVYDPVRFWIWVPGVEWAPAWVSWRVGGGDIGWAPLPLARFCVGITAASFFFFEDHRV